MGRAALLGSVLEMDDVHRAARLHPGPVIWPAAIEAAILAQASGGQMLDAAVRGYEAMVSVGATLDDYHYARWHPTSTAGGFAAAAAWWSLLHAGRSGADATLVSALGLAGSVAGGLWQTRHEGGDAKAFHLARAGAAGREAARLAGRGIDGPKLILEGAQGLFAAMCDRPRPDLLLGIGEGWRIDETSFKPWAACRHAHPAIDAALKLGPAGDGPVRVETYADAITFCDRPYPATSAEARFSIQHAIAVVMVRGRPSPDDFEGAAIDDPALVAARGRVTIAEDRTLTARYPEHFGARVITGGRVAEVADAWGDPECPMSPAAIEAKARALMARGGVPNEVADGFVAWALGGDEAAALNGSVTTWLTALVEP